MRIFSHIPGSNARGIILWQVLRTCATVRAQRMCCVTPLLTLTATQAGSIRGQSRFPSRAGAWSAPDPQGLALRHTGVMTIRNVAAAREALRAGKPDLLVGTREGAWLDAKGEPYQLNEPKWAAELGKDVAALANAGGGLIVIGLRTRRESGSDVIDEVRPVPAKLIDRDRYRKLVRERIFPFIKDFAIWWVPVDEERGILILDVPDQASRDKPFVVSGSTAQLVKGASTVAVPLRDDDGTHWLSGQELQRLLTEGWNVTGPPAPRVVIAASSPTPSVAVGEGDPLWTDEFREAYEAGGGRLAFGDPIDVVTTNGPGVVQRLAGGSKGAAAICAVPDFKPIVLAGDVWKFFLKLCRDSSPNDDASQAGLPVADQTDSAGYRTIHLIGGQWGPGKLIQDGSGRGWRWEPIPTVGATPALRGHLI